MTLANKITISRFFIIPIMVLFGILGIYDFPLGMPIYKIKGNSISVGHFIFIILFIIGSFSDFLDGYFARKKNEVTTFGKFLDPILDKLLVVSAFLILLTYKEFKENISRLYIQIIVAVIIILLREFLITGFRLVFMEEGCVVAAGWLGKIKTAFTMVSIIVLAFKEFSISFLLGGGDFYLSIILLWIAVILTIVSGFEYVIKNRKILKESLKVKNDSDIKE